uniref:EamA domain-containing protein n=1 Tax=viral metagenome TaxID=1070528 RepID=A0A6C0AP88_9ZZZZ
MLAEGLVLFSEVIMSAYPILIKAVPTNLWTQIVSRFLVYSVTASSAIVATGNSKQFSNISWQTMAGAGLLNLAHISVSYKAFADLSPGNAMAIFYTYPIWNIIGAWFLLGEVIPLASMPWILLALIGMFLVAHPEKGSILDLEKPVGTLCALLAALTETAIYFYFKLMKEKEGGFKGLLELYGGAGLWMLPAVVAGMLGAKPGGLEIPKVDLSWKVWLPMILFNTFIGFTGYSMRVTAIPLISTAVFSMLSFFGVVAAYVFGYLFNGEKPTAMGALGALMITVANVVLLSK